MPAMVPTARKTAPTGHRFASWLVSVAASTDQASVSTTVIVNVAATDIRRQARAAATAASVTASPTTCQGS